MTDDKIRQVIKMYQGRLAERDVRPVRSADTTFKMMVEAWGELRPETSINLLDHCAHACVEILKFVDEGRREKAFRWLGWLQCALWVAGIIPTIGDGARDNMPDAAGA